MGMVRSKEFGRLLRSRQPAVRVEGAEPGGERGAAEQDGKASVGNHFSPPVRSAGIFFSILPLGNVQARVSSLLIPRPDPTLVSRRSGSRT